MDRDGSRNEMVWVVVGVVVLAMTCLCIFAVVAMAVLGLPMFFFIQP